MRSAPSASVPDVVLPDAIDAAAPAPESGARALLLALVELTIADSRGAMSLPTARKRRTQANAQWWWLDDDRDASVYGSAAFVCNELGFARDAMAKGLAENLGAALLPTIDRRLIGHGRMFTWVREARPAVAPSSLEIPVSAGAGRGGRNAGINVWRTSDTAPAIDWSWDAIVQRDVLAEIRAEARAELGLPPMLVDLDDDLSVIEPDVVETDAAPSETWADVAEWAASLEPVPPPRIADVFAAKLQACGNLVPPGRALRAEATVEVLAAYLGVPVPDEIDAFAIVGGLGFYDKGDQLHRFVTVLRTGVSLREACRQTGVASRTGQRVLAAREAILGAPLRCACGIPLRVHRGWCTDRVASSPARQAVVARLVEHHAKRGGMLPVILGQDDDGHVIFTPSEPRTYDVAHGAKAYCLTCHHGVRVVQNVAVCRRRDCAEAAERRRRRAAVVA